MAQMDSYCFQGSDLDRAAHLRLQTAELLGRADARILPIWRGKILVAGDPADRVAWLEPGQPGLGGRAEDTVFLGLEDGAGAAALLALVRRRAA